MGTSAPGTLNGMLALFWRISQLQVVGVKVASAPRTMHQGFGAVEWR